MAKFFTVVVRISVLAVLMAVAASAAAQQDWPDKPIRVIVPFPPGGSTDPLARAFGKRFSDKFGVAVVIDNRPGAGGTIGHALGAKAPADGYTLTLVASSGIVVNPALGTKLPYDPAKDFEPVALGAYAPFLLVVPSSLPAKNLKEFIELGKAQPRKFNYGSPGIGTPSHIGMEMLQIMTGAHYTHVPYKGGAPATVDLLAGRIEALFGSPPQFKPHLSTGKIRILAVGHPTRLRSMPEVPAIAETLPGFNNTSWYGFLVPTGTPAPIIRKIAAESNRALDDAEFRNGIEFIGLEPANSGTPEEFGAMIRSELARWTKVIRDANIHIEDR